MTGLVVALGFMTRLPVGRGLPLTASLLSRAALWFPLVGLLVGAVAGGVHALVGLALPGTPAAVLAILAAVVLTGGLHEDGLADAADAMGAHATRARKLEILHDPRVGTYGALALVFAVLLAVALLGPLDDLHFLKAAIVGHVLGRWSTLPLSLVTAALSASRTGALVRASPATFAVGTALAAGAVAVTVGALDGLIVVAVVVLVTAGGRALGTRSLGGVSGDVYGAVNKAVELAAYATLAAVWA